MTIEGSVLGVHRSIEPTGVLPQAAWRLDNRPQLWPSEARLDVELLSLDPVVLRRLRDAAGGDPYRFRASILETVAERSKPTYPALAGLVNHESCLAFESSLTLADRHEATAGGGRAGRAT